MTINKMMIPPIKHILALKSFHHICFLTRFAPLLNPCADCARLSVLSCNVSNLSPRSATLLMFSRMMPTVSSICACMAAVFDGAEEEEEDGTYGS